MPNPDAMAETAVGLRLQRLGYRRARLLLLVAGLAVLAVIGALTYVRSVEPIEVTATLLFLPIFVAVVFWKMPGGITAGLLAAGLYTVLRYPAIDAVGLDRFLGLIVSRSVAFVAFGAIAGWASRQLESSVRKLEAVDRIDDATGLFNARYFLEDTDLEMSRAQRYQTIFSVSALEIRSEALAGLSGRRRARVLRELGRELGEAVRKVDRAVHAIDTAGHRIAVILPETGREGAQVFTRRLLARVASFLSQRGASISEEAMIGTVLTLPDDAETLGSLREEFAAIDRAEHPEVPAAGA